jgi:nucleotide-binding universal stress UspA family protein
MAHTEGHTADQRDVVPAPLLIVAGFDTSQPAVRALDAATRLLCGREGSLHVVYVSHPAVVTELSAEATMELDAAYDEMAEKAREAVRQHLHGREDRWSFEHRRGDIAHELIEAADQLRSQQGCDFSMVIVVGTSSHRIHHFVGSVPLALVRQATVPLLVVP